MTSAIAYQSETLKSKEFKRYTLEEYLLREDRSKHKHEFYNGEIIKLPMARTPHQLICTNLIYELESAFRKDDKTFNVLSNGQLVYLPELNFTLYPDVLVVSEKLVHQERDRRLLGHW